ncbi:hypothetical protein ACLB1G_25735 [Oxalobacteraceae bacterium A2-2]
MALVVGKDPAILSRRCAAGQIHDLLQQLVSMSAWKYCYYWLHAGIRRTPTLKVGSGSSDIYHF